MSNIFAYGQPKGTMLNIDMFLCQYSVYSPIEI